MPEFLEQETPVVESISSEEMRLQQAVTNYEGYLELQKTYKKQKREHIKKNLPESLKNKLEVRKDLSAQIKEEREVYEDELASDDEFVQIENGLNDAEIDMASEVNDIMNLVEQIEQRTGQKTIQTQSLLSEKRNVRTVHINGREVKEQ